MTGGMAFIYDKDGTLPVRINLNDVIYQQRMTEYWESFLLKKLMTIIKKLLQTMLNF